MVRNNSASNKALIATELFNSINSSLQQSNISRKSKFRYLLARSDNFEKQTAELLQSLSAYARRTAKLRDSGDIVSEAFNSISIAEVLNPSLKRSLAEFAKSYRCIQDHRDSEVLFLEEKLLRNVAEYGEKLQKQREELRSNISKVFDGRDRGSSWIKSANSNRRQRSQSLERTSRPSKEEKALHQAIQRYELKRNLILKKLILKFISSELRFTVRSLNNLTYSYQTIARHLDPSEDLQLFNEFFNFKPINKRSLSKVKDDVESDDEEGDNNEEPDETTDASYDSNNDSDKDVDNLEHDDEEDDEDDDDDPDEEDEDDSDSNENHSEDPTHRMPIQSALKRFNSTPEISSSTTNLKRTETGDKSNPLSSSKENLNNKIFKTDQSKDGQIHSFLIKNKLNFKSSKSTKQNKTKNKKKNKKKSENKNDFKESETSGTEDDDDEEVESKESDSKSRNESIVSKNNSSKKNGGTVKLFKNKSK